MNTRRRIRSKLAIGVVALGAVTAIVVAGEMNPWGPPGPTMKPLNEVEPRIPIYAEQLPLVITQPGSYYLAENITTSGAGITIDTNNVTIDLMGFTLEGGTGNGITVLDPNQQIWIRNGTIARWEQHGIAAEYETVVSDVTAKSNHGNGIQLGQDSQVIDCIADNNTGHGIVLYRGIVRGCRSSWNFENGIWADFAKVADCVAIANRKNGIRVDDATFVVGCQAAFNDQNQSYGKAGIWVKGDGNRIEGNHLNANNVGLDIDGNDNVIIRNTILHSRTIDVDVAPGATGNLIDIRTSLTGAGPWSNFVK